MTAFQLKTTASVLAIVLTGTVASANVTAQQVWDSWKAQMGSGATLTVGNESLAGGVLSVTDLAIEASDETGGATISIDSLTFTEQADGTVLITQSDVVPMSVTTTDPASGMTTSMSMTLTQTNASIIASGTPEAMNHAITAGRMAIEIAEITIDGETAQGTMVIGLNDLAGGYTTTGTASPMGITSSMTIASMDLFADLTVDGERLGITGKGEAISAALDGMLAIGPDVTPANTFDMGTTLAGNYAIGPMSVQVAAPTGGSADVVMAASSTSFDFSAASMAFDSSVNGLDLSVTDPTMPFPINLSLAEFGVGMGLPAAPTDAPAPFNLRFALRDLTANEDLWAMFDPGMALPRDPVTAVIDVAGTAITAINLYDPEAQAALATSGAPPGELHSLDITEVALGLGGASLNAMGALTFDNSTMATTGMPTPTGAIDININGANALMDNLVAMGLIPEDQVMMARMMIGMFAVPTGDDALTSKIEFTPDGGISANGQRIQ
jgi:hypothetical protein